MPTAAELREEFLLDPEVTFLNHGSFGACPRPVFERYQAWQLELERQPVNFISHRLSGLLAGARAVLADYVGAKAEDLTFVQNATTGVNLAARSLELRPGDEVLTSNLEYGACEMAWEWLCARSGARLVRAEVPLPLTRGEDVVEALFSKRTERTRVLYVSQITSSTALKLPIEALVARARAEGLISVIDGAHAPSQIPLDLEKIGADFYAGNCHKWLCAPKGSGFLYVRPEHQERVDGAIVSWGYREPATFLSRTSRQGTRDDAAYLAISDAIAFQRERAWEEVRERCRLLALEAQDELCALFGSEPLATAELQAQMVSVRLPAGCDGAQLEHHLWDDYRIEVPVMKPGRDLLRVSVAAYTRWQDIERLLSALPQALRASRSASS